MKYVGQQCQDDLLNQKFRVLHHQIVNAVIQFCKENDITTDEFHLSADGVDSSIPYGEWESCTDSCFTLEKFTDEYKEAMLMERAIDEQDWKRIKCEQKPFMVSI